MSIIKVTVDDQALYVTESPVVAAQGVNENYFQFALSADWTGFGVAALFWKEGNEDTVYESVVDGTGKALVPHEVTDLQGRFCVGLAGTKGNIIHTSEVLKYKVVKGRYTAGQGSEPPTPGIYEQMLSLAGQMSDQFRQVVEEQSEVIEDLQEDQAALRSELTAQQTTFQNTISGQMASFIASQSGDYGATVLWDMDVEGDHNGALAQDTVLTLRENIEGFDFIEVWGFNNDVDDSVFIPVEKLSGVGTAVKSVNIGLGTTKLRIVETRLMGQYNELTIAHQFIFTFDTTHTATRITQDNKSTYVSQFGISRVIGRKMVQNAELVDIRVGENGTTYQTAGAAVRGQFTEVKAQIPAIDASLATTGKAADAKATGDALTAVNGRLQQETNNIYNGIKINASMFEKGNIEAGNNNTYRQLCRCRLIDKAKYSDDIVVTITGNTILVGISYYDESGTYTSYVSVQNGSYTIPANSIFRLFVEGKRGLSATEMSISEILEGVEFSEVLSGMYSMDADIKRLDADVSDIKTQLYTDEIPDYYLVDDYLPNKARTAQLASNVNGISFGFVTDVHTGDSARNSMKVAKYLADRTSALPFMICGGDIPETNTGTVDGLHEQAMLWQEMMSQYGKHRVYTCRGNHDYLSKLSDRSSYNASHGTCHSYVMGYMPDRVVVSGSMKMSYYVDFDTVKTRIVVVDEYDISDSGDFTGYVGLSPAQFHWLVDTALNIADYKIIIVAHEAINPSDYTPGSSLTFLKNIITAYRNHEAFSGSYGATSINVDFSTYTSELVCVLSGHAHRDYSYSDGFLTIGCTSDAIYDTDGYNRAQGQINEIAFDIISIDFDTRTIKCTRIGAGNDRMFDY